MSIVKKVFGFLGGWWVTGAIGWALIWYRYPIDAVLPTYAQ